MTFQEYLNEHGINETTVNIVGLHEDNNRIAIPIRNIDDQVLWYKYRHLDPSFEAKFTFDQGAKITLFNVSVLKKPTPFVVICEGEPDCMKLTQEGFWAVCSTGGAGSFNKEWINLFIGKNILLCLDNDEAGRNATKKLLNFFPKARVISLPEAYKDVCEFFKDHTKAEFIEFMKQYKNKKDWLRINFPSPYSTITLSEIYQKEFPEEEWIVDKILPEEGIIGIIGEAGAFKSLFTQYLTKCLITKETILGQFEVKKECNILFIDKENRLRRTQKRLLAFGVPSTERIRFIESPGDFNLENEEFIKFIIDEIEEYRINLIFVDAFVDVFEGNENDAIETRKALDKLKQLAPQGTFIVIHHSSKPIPRYRRTALQSTRGSSNIAAQFEAQFYFEKTRDNKVFTIEQGKARDSEPLKKFSVQIVYEPDGPITDLIYLGETKEDEGLVEEAVEKIIEIVFEKPGIDRDTLEDYVKEEVACSSKIFEKGLTEARKRKKIAHKRKTGQGNKFFYYPFTEPDSDPTLFDDTE